ncbi:transmembrane protein C9orf91 [Pitangus sulphuratus]|nr:transmembrane protein C9orf91 [Pitangus sulphuratus]
MMRMEDRNGGEGKEPLKDLVLLVLSMDNTCSTSSFDVELCAEKLKALGVQINVNTDVRLAAVNEIFIKHSLILGITDVLEGPHNILQLWFLHFSPERCLRALSSHLTHLQRMGQAGLRHRLDKLCVVMEAAVQPDLGTEDEEAPCEESPLLSSGENLNKKPVTCNELLCLVPEGPPEVMAQQLLVIFSGCYVRLLVTGQLPGAVAGGHLEHSPLPCLCQFIQTTVLDSHQGWFPGRVFALARTAEVKVLVAAHLEGDEYRLEERYWEDDSSSAKTSLT